MKIPHGYGLGLSLILFFTFQVQAAPRSVDLPLDPANHTVTPLEQLANDKEEHSVLLGDGRLTRAQALLGDFQSLEGRLTAVAQGLADFLYSGDTVACEQSVFTKLSSLLSEHHFPNDSGGLEAVLVALRSTNRIDDLFLLPMIRYLPVYALNSASAVSPNCASDRYLSLFSNLKQTEGRRFRRKHFLRWLSSPNETIGNDEALFRSLYANKWIKHLSPSAAWLKISMPSKTRLFPKRKRA